MNNEERLRGMLEDVMKELGISIELDDVLDRIAIPPAEMVRLRLMQKDNQIFTLKHIIKRIKVGYCEVCGLNKRGE